MRSTGCSEGRRPRRGGGGSGSPGTGARWRHLLDRAWRVAAIAAFAVAVFLFGHRNSPLNPPAEATVYMSLGESFAGVPSVWELQVDPGTVQQASLNGNRIFYTVERDWRPVGQVLDYYEELYSGPPQEFGGAKPSYPPPRDDIDWEAVRQSFNAMATNRGLRVNTENWGLYGTVVLPDPDEPGYLAEMERRASAFLESGRIADMGEAKFVYALRAPGSSETTVMTAWPDPEFDLDALVSDGRDDVPGSDPPGVPRMAGDLRILSFVQERAEMNVYMAEYQARVSPDAAVEHYRGTLAHEGWTEDVRLAVRSSAPGTAPEALFTRGRQQCHVSSRVDERTGDAITTVIVTTPPGPA